MVALSLAVLAVWAGLNAFRIDRVAWIINASSVWQVSRQVSFFLLLLASIAPRVSFSHATTNSNTQTTRMASTPFPYSKTTKRTAMPSG